jgi:hypothetical protein
MKYISFGGAFYKKKGKGKRVMGVRRRVSVKENPITLSFRRHSAPDTRHPFQPAPASSRLDTRRLQPLLISSIQTKERTI